MNLMREIRRQYELINEFNKSLEEIKKKLDGGLSEKIGLQIISDCKKEARRLNRLDDKYKAEPDWRPCGESFDDGMYCMYELPGVLTEEEQEEYCNENWCHWYNPYEDGRDCTGVWFTTSLRCIPIPEANKTIVIHKKNCDI